jgi:hypothetical protein
MQAAALGPAMQDTISITTYALSVTPVSVLLASIEIIVYQVQIQLAFSVATSLNTQGIRPAVHLINKIIVDGSVILISFCP